MKKFLFIIFLLILISFANATNVDKKIESELNNKDEAEVIVYLKEPSYFGKYVNYDAMKSNTRKNSIQNLQNDIKLKYEYGSLNGFAGKINKNALEKLKNDPNVQGIYLSQERKIFLQNSLSIINATIVHSKLINNLNLTGKGQSICILDTGINYSHNDFGSCTSAGAGNNCKVTLGYDYASTPDDNDPYDDNGHGTHVAGIAAANGNITGVAPEANITMIKVCDSTGACADNDIIAGIDWCNNNRTRFNINVISMSLGGVLYTNYCNEDSIAPSINTAVGNNITVTIATGNSGSNSQISSPACIQNATSVAYSTKQDAISSFSNRNGITDVIAPGTSINSSCIISDSSTGYCVKSGTSMATPHVAGIVALLQQYKKEESNRTLTQNEVETALKNSDKNITDTTGLNYTRANVDKALISIDTKKPTFIITINPNPANVTNHNVSINFSGLDTNLNIASVNVTYPNGTLISTSSNNFTLLTTNLTVTGNYNVTFYTNDTNNNVNITTKTLTINNPDLPIITLNSPENNLNTSNMLINFNCSATENINLANISLYINSTGNFILNQTNNVTGASNNTRFNLTLQDGTYIWNCLAYDNSSNSAFASNNFTFRVDTLKPNLESILSSSITSSSAIISWITNELSNSTVNYGTTINVESVSRSSSFVTSHSITLSSLSSSTTHYYNVTSCDLINNCNTSKQFNFTTSASSGNGGSGGSGGGGGGGGGSGGSTQPSIDNSITSQEIQEIKEIKEQPKEEVKNKDYGSSGSSTKEDVKALVELNQGLNKGLNFFNLNSNNVKIPEEVKSERKILVKDNYSELILKIKINNSLNNFLVYDEVPKKFASSTDKLTIIARDANITIIEKDPVIMFYYSEVKIDEVKEVKYIINEKVDINVIDEVKKPVFLVKEETEKVSLFKKYYVFIISVIVLIILAFFSGELIEWLKLKKTRK